MATIIVCSDTDRPAKRGIVNETDYRHLLVKMAETDGLEPKVVLLNRYMREQTLFGFRQQEECVEWNDDLYDSALNDRIQLLVMPLFGDTPLTDVKAVILPEEVDYSKEPQSRVEPWGWLVERLPEDVAIYRLRRCERGGPNWLESLGSSRYGGHLPAETAHS